MRLECHKLPWEASLPPGHNRINSRRRSIRSALRAATLLSQPRRSTPGKVTLRAEEGLRVGRLMPILRVRAKVTGLSKMPVRHGR